MINKRIILVGPSASGKNYLRDKFLKRGFSNDISYTTRDIREGEKDGVDYHFISKENFEDKINNKFFYEYTKYRNNYYGTGLLEWKERNIFIMETEGVSKIHKDDRETSFIIYINTPESERIHRMLEERKWSYDQVYKRLEFDRKCFADFVDFDMVITSTRF